MDEIKDLFNDLNEKEKEEMKIALIAAGAAVLLYMKRRNSSMNISHVGVSQWDKQIREAAAEFDIPAEIIAGTMWQESRGRADSIGSAGEIGLMQLKEIAIRDLRQNGFGSFNGWDTDPEQNIRAGAAFLRLQYRRAGADWFQALRAYNRGFAGSRRDPESGVSYAESVIKKANEFKSNDDRAARTGTI